MVTEIRETSTPLPVIWARLVDVENWPSWTESMDRVERLDEGPLRVGSRARTHQPGLQPMEWQVTSLVENQEFTWENRQPGIVTVAGHILTATPEGTHIELTLEQRGPLAWLGRLIAGRKTAQYVRMEADGLARPAN